MSKAIAGAAILGGSAILGAATLGLGFFAGTALEAVLASSSILSEGVLGLAATGVAMEAGAIASALTSNRGMDITTRQAAANRQIIYGQQRVGGVMIYNSTTGSSHDQMNFVIVLAGHVCHSIQNLYLDGRQVHWLGSGAGYSVRNGVGFGGIADNNTYTGPNGVQYNFGGTGHKGIYCEARYGDQSPGDVMGSLTANDSHWAADGLGNSPWVGGCTYIYLKIEFNTNLFPQQPEIRLTVNGKDNIFDPRTGTTGFTQNLALIAADIITDTQFGMGDNSVNQAQLIAAANVCDEQVNLAVAPGTLTESRYSTGYHYDTSTAPMDALKTILSGADGQITQSGGEWYIWPSYWQGPSASFSEADLRSEIKMNPFRPRRELCNRVSGTYTAPTYPYNVAGNLYDQNGWYNGTLQNNFPYAYQTSNFPEYAQDTLHGYASDQWLNADGKPLPMEIALPTVLSVTQAQRVAKIMLLRSRHQGSYTFDVSVGVWGQIMPKDVISLSFARNGWAGKSVEVTDVQFKVVDVDGVQIPRVSVTVIDTDISIYAWSPTPEELTPLAIPAGPSQNTYNPTPPTGLTLTSGAGTALVGLDGSVQPRIEVQWSTPLDILTKQIQVQYSPAGLGQWITVGLIDVALNVAFVTGVVAGQSYDVQIRGLRANGAASDWDQALGHTVSITLSITGDITPVAPSGTLIGESFSDGTAQIIVEPFTATYGLASVSCLSGGPYTITGLSQTTLYYVYYIDASFAGGSITPIATTNSADFIGRLGYFLIGSITTPFAGSGGGAVITRYMPSAFHDVGSRTTIDGPSAYDGNSSTEATTSSTATANPITLHVARTFGSCTYSGFPSFVTTTAMNLSVSCETNFDGDGGEVKIFALVGGALISTMLNTTTATGLTTYTAAITIGTDISTVTINVVVDADATPLTTDTGYAEAEVYEIYIS